MVASEKRKSAKKAKGRGWEIAFWLFGSFFLAVLFAGGSPASGVVLGALALVLGVVGLFGKLRRFRIGRWRSVGLVLMASLVTNVSTQEWNIRSELAALQDTSTVQYLDKLKEVRSEDTWLSELQRLDPTEYAAEMSRREAETARLAEEERQLEAERVAAHEQEAAASREAARQRWIARSRALFVSKMNNALTETEQLVFEAPQSIQDVGNFLRRLDRFVDVVAEAEEWDLTPEEAEQRQLIKQRLSEFQVLALPRMRDALGPLQRQKMTFTNGSAKTFGSGFKIIELRSPRYTLRSNIEDDERSIRQTLMKLRFNKVVFIDDISGAQVTYNLNASPPDVKVVYWEGDIPNVVK